MDILTETLKQIVGPGRWTTDEHELEPHVTEWRGDVRGRARIMVQPSSTAEVADILGACNEARVAVVPQGGNTGTCAGAVPDASGQQVILNLSRLNRIRSLDRDDFSLIADAGCVLADLQRAAEDAGLLLPLSHGGEGSSQIGGNLSTNAGGINVLRYGTARNLVLGVEVVLANGTVWDGLRTLRKDTSGYDMKQVFIGSEGTLGVITAAALRLYPSPGPLTTALVALASAQDAVTLLGLCRNSLGDRIQAFELISAAAFELVTRHLPGSRVPFDKDYPWFVLMDVATAAAHDVENALESAGTLLQDGTIAKNETESAALWRMRHAISESEKRQGAGAKHDISVPVGRIGAFLAAAAKRLAAQMPHAQPVVFGHVGDGNLHYNVMLPPGTRKEQRAAEKHRISKLVYDLVVEQRGSISAEHGIGLVKRPWLLDYKDPAELALMQTLKTALDPNGILNPGKVI